jgi:hypothetical protein
MPPAAAPAAAALYRPSSRTFPPVMPANAGPRRSKVMLADSLSILPPIVRILAAHLTFHLLQHIGGCPPGPRATGTTLIANRLPRCPGIAVPRLQGQRAAGAIGTKGISDNALEEHGKRGRGGLGPHHLRPHRNRETRPPKRPDDDCLGTDRRPMGDLPRGEALTERSEHATDRVVEAAYGTPSVRRSRSIERHRIGSHSPRVPLVLRTDASPVRGPVATPLRDT